MYPRTRQTMSDAGSLSCASRRSSIQALIRSAGLRVLSTDRSGRLAESRCSNHFGFLRGIFPGAALPNPKSAASWRRTNPYRRPRCRGWVVNGAAVCSTLATASALVPQADPHPAPGLNT